MGNALDLCTAAMAEIGAVAQGETLSANDGAFCLGKLNRLVDAWKTRRQYVYCVDNASYPWVVSQASYTIGPTGNFVAARPVRIEAANLVSSAIRTPLVVVAVDDRAALTVPVLSGTPTHVYYQATHPNGTLWPWPYPTVLTDSIELFTWHQIATFAALNTVYALAPGYEDALIYTLAESLCPSYGRQITSELAELARRARYAIGSLNTSSPKLSSDFPLESSGDWDYRTGNLA